MREIFCLDPGVRIPEVDSYNQMVSFSTLPMSYHLPAILGMQSVYERQKKTRLAGVVVLGSSSSVHDQFPWQMEMHHWVKTVALSGVPVVGFCYGHQMLSSIFGGEVGFSPYKIFHRGFREVEFVGLRDFNLSPIKGKVVVSHQEVVSEMPRGFHTIAKSTEFASEGMAHDSLPIWSVQFHPEATTLFCRHEGFQMESLAHKEDLFKFGHGFVKGFLDFCAAQP